MAVSLERIRLAGGEPIAPMHNFLPTGAQHRYRASRCALTTSPTAWAAVPPTTEGASEPMRNQTHIHGASGPTNGRWAGLAFA